jgi:hypothetical protein
MAIVNDSAIEIDHRDYKIGEMVRTGERWECTADMLDELGVAFGRDWQRMAHGLEAYIEAHGIPREPPPTESAEGYPAISYDPARKAPYRWGMSVSPDGPRHALCDGDVARLHRQLADGRLAAAQQGDG